VVRLFVTALAVFANAKGLTDNLQASFSRIGVFNPIKYADPVILNMLRENERRISSIPLAHERLFQSKEVNQVSMDKYVDLLLSTLERKLVPLGLSNN